MFSIFFFPKIDIFKKDSASKAICLIFSVLLFIFIGFRYEVGADWIGYNRLLDYRRIGMDVGTSDPLFLLIVEISNLFSFSWSNQAMVLQFAFLFVTCIYYHFLIQKKEPLSLLRFYVIGFPIIILLLGMGYLRQGLSAVIILICWEYFKRKQIALTFIFTLLAVSIHKSALIFLVLPIYLISKDFFIKRRIAAVALGLCTAVFFVFLLFNWGGRYLDHSMTSSGVYIRYVFMCLLIVILAYLKHKLLNQAGRPLVWIALIVSIFICGLFSTLADRVILFTLTILFSELSSNLRSPKQDQIILYSLAVLSFAYTFFWLKFSYWGHSYWVPYKFFLFQ